MSTSDDLDDGGRSVIATRDDRTRDVMVPSATRDDRAREAMALAPTMSPRDACMRILVRRCALHVMRVATVITVLLAARTASAHSLDIGYLRLEPAGASTRVILDLDRNAAAQMLDAPGATADALRARARELAGKTYAREAPSTTAGPCTLDAPAMEITGVTVRLRALLHCPRGERTWRFPFVTDTHVSATFELLVKDAATDRMTVVDRASPAMTFGVAVPASSAVPVTTASAPKPGGARGRSMFLIGGLLAGVMLAPLARFALRR